MTFLPSPARFLIALVLLPVALAAADPIDIGSRLELFVDDYLLDKLSGGARRVLHRPVPREVSLDRTKPWEGNASGYTTVFQDGDLYRMYYRGLHIAYSDGESEATNREVVCYAESRDGIHWKRPRLGLVESDGSKENNIIWDGVGSHNFTVFKDANPNCPRESRYKALGGHHWAEGGLQAFQSADGIHWQLMTDELVVTKGKFDSQNVAFWDSLRNEYRAYWRDSRRDDPKYPDGRDIRTATSRDFVHWSESRFLDYTPGRPHQLYTNGVIPYHRAPHIFLGFPTRYVDYGWSESTKALPQLDYRRIVASKSQRSGTAMTDGVFMASRDGHNFELWPEAFRRPGIERPGSWFYGDNYGNWGLVETPSSMEGAPNELSIYASEGGRQPDGNRLRRYTLRLDGFVSVQAPFSAGGMITKPLVFKGDELFLNFSTSTVGSVRVELQDATGSPIEGFTLDDCPSIYGDTVARKVVWKKRSDVSTLAGKALRLRFELKDADLYSFQVK